MKQEHDFEIKDEEVKLFGADVQQQLEQYQSSHEMKVGRVAEDQSFYFTRVFEGPCCNKEHKGKEQEKMKKISNALVALYPQDDVTINDATLFALLALNRKRFHTHHTVF